MSSMSCGTAASGFLLISVVLLQTISAQPWQSFSPYYPQNIPVIAPAPLFPQQLWIPNYQPNPARQRNVDASYVSFLQTSSQYPGKPPMNIRDGSVEGNGALYAGNNVPGGSWDGNLDSKTFNSKAVWKNSAYFQYFKNLWGDAPFVDGNFQVWLAGGFKGATLREQWQSKGLDGKPIVEDVPRRFRAPTTNFGMATFQGYYGKSYNPVEDPPFDSDYSLFGSEGKIQPDMSSEAIKEDCTTPNRVEGGTWDRPCGVREKLRKTFGKEKKHMGSLNFAMKMGRRNYKTGYFDLDGNWASAAVSDEKPPPNFPPPPPEPEAVEPLLYTKRQRPPSAPK